MIGRSIRLSLCALFATGCLADENVDTTSASATTVYDDVTTDSIGSSDTASPTKIDLSSNNPFFHNFGTNGRTCGTCHAEAFGWTITPAFAASRPANDPLFVFDGSDCLPPGVSNPNPTANSRQMLANANIRIDIGIPATADFTLVGYTDPLNCPNPPTASDLRMYRRPLPSANSAFLATVMWDGRENVNPPNNTISLIQADLKDQSNGATLGHAQASSPLSSANQTAIMTFETGTFNAQSKIGNLNLKAGGGHGGGAYLLTNVLPTYFIGVNDVLGCSIPNSCAPNAPPVTFTSQVFTIYKNWEPGVPAIASNCPPTQLAAAIGRGEQIFNTKTFAIDNVAGINRDPGDPLGAGNTFNGFCGTCHDTPNIGNHSTSLPINIGVTDANPVGPLDISL